MHQIYANSKIHEEDFAIVSSVMGDMGIITHFSDCIDLHDFIVLKPQWLTKAISRVADYEKVFEIPKGWWVKASRFSGTALDVLRIGVKVAFAASLATLGPAALILMKDDLAAMDKLADAANEGKKALSEIAGKSFAKGASIKDTMDKLREIGGDENFRRVRLLIADLLKELDPDSYKTRRWGELQRVPMKDKTHRWLCEKHAAQYRKMF